LRRQLPKVEAQCVNHAGRICAAGAPAMGILTAMDAMFIGSCMACWQSSVIAPPRSCSFPFQHGLPQAVDQAWRRSHICVEANIGIENRLKRQSDSPLRDTARLTPIAPVWVIVCLPDG
ncbi:MAG TPA: hypothetical protein VIS99_02765, partial [Terrimicrobiaceae bacterium]